MKNIKYLVLCMAIALINCERDDICASTTTTTPRLIIEFYDMDDAEELKDVPRLTAYGEGLVVDENGMVTEPTASSDSIIVDYENEDLYVFDTNTDIIALPLKLTDDLGNNFVTTRYVLEKDTSSRLDTDEDTVSNIDILEITYQIDFSYVSRACGYKTIFTQLNVTRILDSNPWISSIIIEDNIENSVENENTTHVRIYH
ncbi:hypothetical protein HNV08_09845 [Winogradskyella eckloniae]|uniref:DUF6452 family protein n=1 Tax=Winogradskyella eckloniae TaxID=1089306 RepID=UPI00156388BC|nr:DUF6452 family protein [Winogradskyella eckloniae]NRD20348.1 hypothetical protein [Winogradskyella eckloniae]